MASITKEFLSGSTNGRPIKIAATATAGTTLHTAPAGTTSKDEVTVYFANTDTVERSVTVEFGGVTAPDDHMRFLVPPGESILGIPGIPINNTLVVKAFAAAANVVTAWGYVNRIS